MKSTPSTSSSFSTHPIRLRPIILPSPPVKLASGSSFKMKSAPRQAKRLSPKQPLPSISTLFDFTSTSNYSTSASSSATSSYGSYCQFSPEGTYTMYSMPTEQSNFASAVTTQTTNNLFDPQENVEVHKPVNQPLFIQICSDYQPISYPTNSTINASQLLLRPVPNC
ncbi:unnamed protein product [Caenorhabditis angaria]|uniref:Uncharacterized protein n=1 Tax=Caenorhabditis angaria TaxID=860376 RepID=A0A9P1IWJ0_9PELO|nr:unnamed protein product [Caenorhabditis angaria]